MLTKRIKLNLFFKLSYLNSNFELTLGYLNPALNNSDLNFIRYKVLQLQNSKFYSLEVCWLLAIHLLAIVMSKE